MFLDIILAHSYATYPYRLVFDFGPNSDAFSVIRYARLVLGHPPIPSFFIL